MTNDDLADERLRGWRGIDIFDYVVWVGGELKIAGECSGAAHDYWGGAIALLALSGGDWAACRSEKLVPSRHGCFLE